MEKSPDDDLSLWLRFKNGDKEAFAALYQMHIISLLAYGHKLCPDQEILNDTIQELFIEIWNTRQKLAITDSVKFYLFKALRYKLIRFEKRSHAQARLLRTVADIYYNPSINSIETSIIDQESNDSRIAILRKAIKGLTLRQQEIIQLRFYQGFTNEQIAELLD